MLRSHVSHYVAPPALANEHRVNLWEWIAVFFGKRCSLFPCSHGSKASSTIWRWITVTYYCNLDSFSEYCCL